MKASVEVPSCGAVSLIPAEGQVEEKAVAVETCDGGFTMENSQVKAVINEKGEVISFVLKGSGREFAADAMNRFHLYKDVPRMFDAWDIDSNYIDQEIEAAKNVAVSMEADGLEGVLKVTGEIAIPPLHSISVWRQTAEESSLRQRLTGKKCIVC